MKLRPHGSDWNEDLWYFQAFWHIMYHAQEFEHATGRSMYEILELFSGEWTSPLFEQAAKVGIYSGYFDEVAVRLGLKVYLSDRFTRSPAPKILPTLLFWSLEEHVLFVMPYPHLVDGLTCRWFASFLIKGYRRIHSIAQAN
jgi:hypothetical protein